MHNRFESFSDPLKAATATPEQAQSWTMAGQKRATLA